MLTVILSLYPKVFNAQQKYLGWRPSPRCQSGTRSPEQMWQNVKCEKCKVGRAPETAAQTLATLPLLPLSPTITLWNWTPFDWYIFLAQFWTKVSFFTPYLWATLGPPLFYWRPHFWQFILSAELLVSRAASVARSNEGNDSWMFHFEWLRPGQRHPVQMARWGTDRFAIKFRRHTWDKQEKGEG